MSVKVYTKHPIETREVDFDFTAELAKTGAAGLDAEVITDDGVDVELIASNPPLFSVLVAGGEYGKSYKFGLQLLDDKGAVHLDLRRMRVQGPVIDGSFDGNADEIFIDGND